MPKRLERSDTDGELVADLSSAHMLWLRAVSVSLLYRPALQAPPIALGRRTADHALNARHTAIAPRTPSMAGKTQTPAKKHRSKRYRAAAQKTCTRREQTP